MLRKNNLTLELLLYKESDYTIPYYDMECGEITMVNDDEFVSNSLLPIPSKDNLMPYNEAIGTYITDRNLSIPVGMSASRYLREHGLQWDYYAYWDELAASKLKVWFEQNQITF